MPAPIPASSPEIVPGGATTPSSDSQDPKSSSKMQKPTHPHVGRVDYQPGDFCSSYKATRAFSKGDRICTVTVAHDGPKAYSSVQYGRDSHFELGSDLVFINHSCHPNVAFNISSPSKSDWHLLALDNIELNDEFVFFYPSTEWSMDQPFECRCGAENCLRTVSGAKDLSLNTIEAHGRGYVSPHIVELVRERDAGDPGVNGA